eukprot:jgi/Phyca11/503456/fgenesh2_kg.PHYCAscaffold_3_\
MELSSWASWSLDWWSPELLKLGLLFLYLHHRKKNRLKTQRVPTGSLRGHKSGSQAQQDQEEAPTSSSCHGGADSADLS